MRTASILALATGAAAMNATTPVATPAPTNTPSVTKPGSVAGWTFYGCVSSTSGFPSFKAAESNMGNSPEACAAQCKGSTYFGLHETECYCGDTIDTSSKKVDSGLCGLECPGAPGQSCGGNLAGSRLARRQNVPLSFLLSIYESAGTTTVTVPGSVTTQTTTVTQSGGVTTVTNNFFNVPAGVSIVCYGDYCVPQFNCPSCTRWQVVCRDGSCCPQPCTGDDWDRLVVCKGNDCKYSQGNMDRKISCQGSKCTVEKTSTCKKLSCSGSECRHVACTGDACGKKEVCKGNACTPVTTCTGASCPKPNTKTPTPSKDIVYIQQKTTGSSSSTSTSKSSSCSGANCPVKTPVIASGAGKNAVAGLAALIAGAVFAL